MTDQPRRFWTTRRAWLAAGALGLLALGVMGVRGHHGHRLHALSDEDIRFTVSWVLREVDASDEQVAAVTAIATRAATDLKALHAEHRSRRDAFTQALVGADRSALETLRGEELATVEDASQRIVSALADAAEVLTPEQRQRLAEAHARHHEQHD